MTVFKQYTHPSGLGLRQAFAVAKKEGKSIRSVARNGRVSHTTGNKWAKRTDFQSRKSGPARGHGSIKLHEIATTLIRILRSERFDIARILYSLKSLEPLTSVELSGVSEWTVRRFLDDEGLRRLPNQGQQPVAGKGRGTFSPTKPGFVHIDTIFAPSTNGIPGRFIYVAIERTSRWLYMEARATRTAKDGQDFLLSLIKVCPLKIHTVLTDNGSEWEAEFNTLAKDLLAKGLLKHKHTKPHTPQTNGLVERMNGTIKRKTPFKTPAFWNALPSEKMTPGRHLQGFYAEDARFKRINQEFRQWTFFWNAVLPHRVLAWKTPLEVLKGLYLTDPGLFKVDPSHNTPLDLEEWKVRLGANRFIYPPPGIGNRTPS